MMSAPRNDLLFNIASEEYPFSLGTNKILEALDRWNYSWDTTLINAATIVRNNLEKNSPDSRVLSKVYLDIRALLSGVEDALGHKRNVVDPYIVVYFPDYSKLPKGVVRELSPQETQIDRIVKMLRHQIVNKVDGDIGYVRRMPVYSLLVGSKNMYPHKDLIDRINKINLKLPDVRKILTRRYMLISHIAMDFHLFKEYKNMYLLESYTARIRTREELGEKVFKSPQVPFNTYTHLLFGDSTRIQPSVTAKKKREFLELADKDRWNYLDPEKIKRAILRVEPTLYTKFLTTIF